MDKLGDDLYQASILIQKLREEYERGEEQENWIKLEQLVSNVMKSLSLQSIADFSKNQKQIKKIERFYTRKLQKILNIYKIDRENQKIGWKLEKLQKKQPWKALNDIERELCYSDTSTPYSAYSGNFSEIDEQISLLNSRVEGEKIQMFLEDQAFALDEGINGIAESSLKFDPSLNRERILSSYSALITTVLAI